MGSKRKLTSINLAVRGHALSHCRAKAPGFSYFRAKEHPINDV